MDNAEYYEHFPEVNKSTIRSWKSRASKPIIQEEETTIASPDALAAEGYEELQSEYIKLLMKETGSKESEFKGVDSTSKLMILKNRKTAQETERKNQKRDSNTGIMPSPIAIGQNKQIYGIDDYIVFDKNKDEIRMEIPMTVLLDPDKNKKLGEVK